jgi:Zinc carboxypeptidase
MRKLLAATAAVAAVCAFPAVSSADPTVDAAKAAFDDLGLTQLPGMPSGRTSYRTYADYNADMEALAAANPGLVAVKTAPYASVGGRAVKYVEITNDVNASDGKPVYFNMGAIHGNETPAAEDSMEFAIDVVNLSKTNPKVKALLDEVRIIDMPLVNPDGYDTGTAPQRRANNNGVDMNRNYPFGWGSNIGVEFSNRGSGPGSEPEVKNTMEIVQKHQVVVLTTQHTNSRAIFYPGLDVPAGHTPELNTGYQALGDAMNDAANGWTQNVSRSADDYPTSGETIDWSYYATRGLAYTVEWVGGGGGCPQSKPDYLNCTTADFTGTPGPTSSAAQTARFNGKPGRNMLWQALVYATLPAGHGVIKGAAVPGATLKVTKDFNLYTAPVKQNTTPETVTPPIAIPTHLESSIVVPASGRFTWDVNPSVRPTPAFEADGEHGGPRGFLQESWTITCTAADGTVLGTSKVLVDKGDVATVSPCTPGSVGGTVPATLSLSLSGPASFGAFTPGVANDYTAQTSANVVSTAGDAALSYSDPGHLSNGAFALPEPLQVSLSKSSWTAPVSNDTVAITFKQHIGANDALRTGTYSKTVTFTLSTTNP